MANIKTKRLWDEAWRKLSVFFSPSGAVESPFGALGIRITEPTTLRVETTGSDTTGDGSDSAPFRTVQGALEWLDGSNVQARVTIQVGAGSFPAFSLEGTRITVGPVTNPLVAPTSTGLEIKGTWISPTLASGTASGTASSVVTDLAAVMTDAGQSWTVNDLRGKYVLVGTVYYPIISNTATTITAASSSALTGVYSIWDLGTIINSGTATVSAGSGTGRIAVSNLGTPNTSDFTVSSMYVSMDGLSSGNSGIAIRNSFVTLENVSIVRTTGTNTAAVSCVTGSYLTVTRCYLAHNDATGNGITSATSLRNLTVIGSYFRNGNTGVSTGTGPSANNCSSTTFEGQVTGLSLSSGSQFLINLGTRFLSCTTAISVGTSAGPAALISSTSTTMFFGTCTTILSAQNVSTAALATCSGTGNTNGIVAVKGARCQISSGGALGATNELSVDGTAGTLATMRAASPRVFPLTPNAYGTYIYE